MSADDGMAGLAPDPDLLLDFLCMSDLAALRAMLEAQPVLPLPDRRGPALGEKR